MVAYSTSTLNANTKVTNLTLNRKRAYLDDPMWLLNKACLNATGFELPSGFHSTDWSYTTNSRGKKKGKRTLTPAILRNPLQTHNYYDIPVKILRHNHLEELNQIFTAVYRNLFPEHLKYPILDGFVQFLKDKNSSLLKVARGQMRQTWIEWWDENKGVWDERLFKDRKSKIYCSAMTPNDRSIIKDISNAYFHQATSLYGDWTTDDNASLPEYIPNFIKQGIYAHGVLRLPLDGCDWEFDKVRNKELIKEISPILIYGLGRGDALGFGQDCKVIKVITTRYQASGVVKYVGQSPANDFIRRLQSRRKRANKQGANSLTNLTIYKASRSHIRFECQNGKIVVKKSEWSSWFWSYNLYYQHSTPAQIYAHNRTNALHVPQNNYRLGTSVMDKMRKDSWEVIKQESGPIHNHRYDDYYKHRGGLIYPDGDKGQKHYEKNFKASLSKELLESMDNA